MNMKMKKAFSDLRASPGRALLVVLALVIGLWGIGGLLVSATILRHDLNENFIRTDPPHVILTATNLDPLDLRTFRMRPEIASAEFRDFSFQRIEVSPNDWIPLWLFGVEDFNHFNLAKFYREKGSSVPAPGTMLIERDGQLISSLTVGSRAHVRSGSRNLVIPITGISFDPAQAPATQDHFIYAYVDKTTYAAITGEPVNERLIFRLKKVTTRQEAEAAAGRIVRDLESQGITGTRIKIPKLNEHPHQWQLNTLLLLQGSIGLLAFLMGGVLVSQLMAAILSQQVRQIGVLKAVGASRRQVFQIYLAMVLMLSVAAAVFAIPLAIRSGYAFAYFVAGKLNFQILTTSLPLSVYIYLAVGALALPVLLSLPAVLKGVRGSVYEALNDYGIRPDAGSSPGVLLRLRLPGNMTLALRNVLRKKRRLAITVLTMALGVAIFDTGFNVRQSLWTLLMEVKDGMRYDVHVVFKHQQPRDAALRPFASIGNVAHIETWNGGRGELQSKVISTDNGVGIVALPYDTDLFHLKIERGRWLQKSKAPEVVLNQQAAELYGNPEPGDSLTLGLGGKRVTVTLVGLVKEMDRAKIYMDQDLYDSAANPDHLVNTVMFVAKERSYSSVIALKREIEKAVTGSDLDILYVMSQAERVKIIYDHLNIILTTIVFLALVVLVVSAIGMASATGINIMERTREIGVMRAIGATPGGIYSLFVTEGMIVSMASVVLGLLLSWPLSLAAAPFFGNLMLGNGAALRFVFSATGFWITLITTLIFGWVAGRIPARRAVLLSTRQALAYE